MSAEVTDVTITEDWLKSAGFKWHQLDRQPDKHWVLFLGAAMEDGITALADIGIEVAPIGSHDDGWFCWLRSDTAGRYSRFIHVRHLYRTTDIIALVEAITGIGWKPENHFYGQVFTQRRADAIRKEQQRMDVRLLHTGYPHAETEKDDTMGRALPEHREAYEAARKQAKPEAKEDEING
jgi:hypothetical protein